MQVYEGQRQLKFFLGWGNYSIKNFVFFNMLTFWNSTTQSHAKLTGRRFWWVSSWLKIDGNVGILHSIALYQAKLSFYSHPSEFWPVLAYFIFFCSFSYVAILHSTTPFHGKSSWDGHFNEFRWIKVFFSPKKNNNCKIEAKEQNRVQNEASNWLCDVQYQHMRQKLPQSIYFISGQFQSIIKQDIM